MLKKYIMVTLGCLLLLGCKQEVLEPEQMIQGKFALDDGSGLTGEYLEFENGHLTTYVAELYPFAEGKVWHTDGTPFRSSVSETYIIQEGNLRTSKGTLNGPIEQKDGVLTVGGKKYSALTGFDANPYSKIVAESEVTFPYTEQDFSIPFSIERPIPAGEADVTTNNSQWLTGLKVGEGVITGHLSATSTDRSGSIKLSYTHATDVLVTVKQAPSTFIRPASESLAVEYTASMQTLGYTIENPVTTSTLTAITTVSWISDIQVSGTQISFKVSENNSGANRNGDITLRYVGAHDVTVSVTQKWSASSITLTPSSQTADYTGGLFNFSFVVTNPRANATVWGTSQANWITNVAVSGNSISYKVAENNSGAQRTGKIKLTYGSYATAEFTVTQTWTASSITLTPSSQTADYTGGSFSFNFAVSNPRANTTVTAASQVNWITNVAVSGNTISYKVEENNSGASRTGKIKLTYGSYATAEFTVTQSWAALSITMTPSQTADYTGGSFCFSYSVSNPRTNTTVTAASQNDWITNVTISGNTISYKVAENYSGLQRSGKIKLTYGNYATWEFTVTQTGKPVVSLTLNKSELALLTGASETLIATVDPSDAPIQWSCNKTSVATVDQNGKVTAVGNGSATISVKAGDKTASCKVTVTIPQPDAVDLGLPSGLKWASFNVGASKPEDYGDYYAWGETEPKSSYSFSTYKWCNGSSKSLTRYCPSSKTDYWGGSGSPDNKTSFKDYDYADDAARGKLGGKWRMPTDAEWTELFNNCTWTWTDNYNGTGVAGRIVTSNVDGHKDKSIFLPAAGYRYNPLLTRAGSGGYYWSSSLYTNDPHSARYVDFSSTHVIRTNHDRILGQSVRPVSE